MARFKNEGGHTHFYFEGGGEGLEVQAGAVVETDVEEQKTAIRKSGQFSKAQSKTTYQSSYKEKK